jgi:hypothetical protein
VREILPVEKRELLPITLGTHDEIGLVVENWRATERDDQHSGRSTKDRLCLYTLLNAICRKVS